MVASLKERLKELLIKDKLLKKEDLDKAIGIQKKKGGRLSQVLVSEGFISENDLVSALSQSLNTPPIKLSHFKINREVLDMMPLNIARHYQIIPVSRIGKTLTIAMADPLNLFAIDDIKTLTGYKVTPFITTQEEIKNAIQHYYVESAHEAIEDVAESVKDADVEMVEEAGLEEVDTQELKRLIQETPVVKITNMILSEAIKLRASDALIEPLEKKLRIRYRVDGVLQEGKSPPRSVHAGIVSRIKVMAELDIAERRLPQDGRFKIKLEGREVDFRVSVLPSSIGEKVGLRVLDKSQATLDVDKLGFEESPLKSIKESASHPHGMILICGPTGSGKTTTLYSILKYVDTPQKNIVTVEDPVEYELRGINQVTIRPAIELTFASSLRSILRQDPDVIMVGEIRDFDTVDIAIKAALTGHLVLSTLHTTDAVGSVIRLVNMGVEPFLITSSVLMAAAQRLVRKVCPRCKESYALKDSVAKEIGLEEVGKKDLTFHRGKGCEHCRQTGYKGRMGIIEVLVLTHKLREMILKSASEREIKEEARSAGMTTLRENGLVKARRGETSIEEVLRVTAGD